MTTNNLETEEVNRKRPGREIQGDSDGLSCDASLGMIFRGDLRDIQAGLTGMEPVLKKHRLRLVYKLLYPGRLRISREPITESDADTDGEAHGMG